MGLSPFNVKDLKHGLREAVESTKINISDKVRQNIRKGFIMEDREGKDKLKTYILTKSGEEFVETRFGKER